MTEPTQPSRTGDLRELSTGELVAQMSGQVSRLVREEMRLAQAELKQKGKHAGVGAGLAGTGAILALFGLAALIAAAIAALALVLPVWSSALIVGGVLLLVAAVLGLVGGKRVKRSAQPIPEQAVASVQRDAQMIKESSRRES